MAKTLVWGERFFILAVTGISYLAALHTMNIAACGELVKEIYSIVNN